MNLSDTPDASPHQILDDANLGPLHWKIWFLSAMGIFLDGFDLFIMAVAIPLIAKDFSVNPTEKGAIVTAALLGAVVGASTLGHLTDRWGRKTIFTIDLALFVIFAMLSALSWNIMSLILFRFGLGVAIGADYPISATYISEVIPARHRGSMIVGAFSFQALGMLAGALVGLLVLSVYPQVSAWRWMLAVGVVPAAIVALLRTQVPESPRWQLSRGKSAEASATLVKLLGRTVEAQAISEPELPYSSLFSRQYIRYTILTAVPWFLMDIATYGVGLFTPTIIAAIAFSGDSSFINQDITSTEGAAVIDILLVIGFLLNLLLVDKWGRMRLQMLGFLGMTVGLLLLARAAALPGGGDNNLGLVFSGFILLNLLMNMGPNATTYLLPAEVFPTSLRASGHGLASAAGKVGAVVGSFFLPIFQSSVGLSVTLTMIAGACFLGLCVTWIFRVETKGRSLEDLGKGKLRLSSAS